MKPPTDRKQDVSQPRALPLAAGLLEIVVSVLDLDRASAPLTDFAGWTRNDLTDAVGEQFAAWRVPEECSAIEQALLSFSEETGGHVRFVVFRGCDGDVIRPSQRAWDTGGLMSYDCFSEDVPKAYRTLQRDHGYIAYGEPATFELGEFLLTECIARGPFGIIMGLVGPHVAGDYSVAPSMLSRVVSSACMVRDFEVACRFFQDGLGWERLSDWDFANVVEPGADVFGIPMPLAKDVRRRFAMFFPAGRNNGSIEVCALEGLNGRDYADRAIAPNLGPLVARIVVQDAVAYAAEVSDRGVEIAVGPTEVNIAPYGRMTCFSVVSPDGAIIEFLSAVR